MNASNEELVNIKDIGKTIADSVYKYFRDEENISIINELKEIGINTNYLGKEEIHKTCHRVHKDRAIRHHLLVLCHKG